MKNSGTAGATSVSVPSRVCPSGSAAKWAFQNYEGRCYVSKPSKDWMHPISIYMNFAKPHRISQLGFSSFENNFAPKSFAIVGSSNCNTERITWTELLYVADSGFADNGIQFKTYTVLPQKRQAFPCIGLKIDKPAQGQVALNRITLWEEANG